MNVLAFDTCLGAVSAAVCSADAGGLRVLAESYEPRTSGHAERLMPMIEETVQRSGLALGDIDRLAVTAGPGGFTGVRVGVAAARALALATGKPAVGVTSLEAMAHEARHLLGDASQGRRLVVAVDARAGMVYVQAFDDDAAGEALLLDPIDAAALIGRRQAVIVGSGAAAVAGLVADAGGLAEIALTDLQPHARAVAALAADLDPTGSVRPLYLRRPDAKVQGDKSIPRAAP
jgi:tRNA threonylcarbamoyladenosine biosynthesis protein TsaB